MPAEPGPLLAVYAHPDDETIQAGGLLAREAARGRRVVVVTATRGERGEMIGMPDVEGTAAVPDIRERERRDALAALGVHEHLFLDELAGSSVDVVGVPPDGGRAVRWTDSGMAWVAPGVAGPAPDASASALTSGDLAGQAAALAALIRGLRPSLVLCDEPGGAYGHPDHVRTHGITMAAIDLAAAPVASAVETDDDAGSRAASAPLDGAGLAAAIAAAVASGPWAVPAVGWVVHEDARLLAAQAQVARGIADEGARAAHGGELTVSGGELPSIARSRDAIDVELDVTAVLPRVLAALRSYGSQVYGATIPALDRALLPGRGARVLLPEQAAAGWFALSNDVAQPILPVVSLQLAHGDAGAADLPTQGPAVVPKDLAVGHKDLADGQKDLADGGGRWPALALGVGLGVVVAAIGTLVHRARLDLTPGGVVLPYGMVLAFALVLVATLLARSLGRGTAIIGAGLGVLGTVQALTYLGGAGDVLVAQDTLGLAWLAVSLAGVVVAAFLPARWVGAR